MTELADNGVTAADSANLPRGDRVDTQADVPFHLRGN